MKPHFTTVLALAFCILAVAISLVAQGGGPGEPETVVVPGDGLRLRARLFYPDGHGPFPAILFNHGSGHTQGTAPGGPDHRHPELLGPVFARHGYVFLYLYRRGDGLSAGQGIPSGDRMDEALAAGGQQARNQMQLRLLEGDEMDDAMAGLAYLRALPEVDTHRIAIVGHSFGGSLTVLLAERDPSIRAIVTFGAVGYSWDHSPELRARLTTAVGRMAAAAFFIHAENDFSIGPGKSLAAEMGRLGKAHRLQIYPRVGQTPEEGHDFIHLQIPMWDSAVFDFLDQQLRDARTQPRL